MEIIDKITIYKHISKNYADELNIELLMKYFI